LAGTLVLSAFEPELAPLRPLVRGVRQVTLSPVGIGAVDAAIGAARAIARARPRRVIFVGTAGVYPGGRRRDAASIGDVVVPAALHCVSTAALRELGYLPQPQVVRATPSPALRRALAPSAATDEQVVACPLAITRSAALARRIVASTGASVENLEAFAVARAAETAGVEFAAVLGIANQVGPSAHREWLAHHRQASAAAAQVIAAYFSRRAGQKS
jgi:purine-nucleoside phosphorylase